MPRDRDALLAELGQVAAELEVAEAERTELYAKRLAIYQEARALDPPVTQRELAERAKVTEVAVIQALRKAARQQEAASA
jgi:transcription initiation factor TFIIIB Brf1 subunit/transcription initiation factor TFIIB